jgi:hypothetical protein
MEAKVTISFPCSDADWQKLCNLRNMFSGTSVVSSTPNLTSSDETPLLDALDKSQVFLDSIDNERKDIHIATPLPTKTSRILNLIQNNPGLTRANIAKLARDTYSDISYRTAYATVTSLYMYGKIDNSVVNMQSSNSTFANK